MRNSETEPSKTKWINRYRNKVASMYRFEQWTRRQQLAYIDMRKVQLDDIEERFRLGTMTSIQKHSNAVLYNSINRELKSKCVRFNALDQAFAQERIWLMVGHKHRHQTTLDKYGVICSSLSITPKDI